MSGHKRVKSLHKGLRSLQRSGQLLQHLLIRFCRSFVALLMAPLSLLQMMRKKAKRPVNNSFVSRRPNFSLKTNKVWLFLPFFGKRRIASNAGFVLPTIALLLLIMSLVVSSMLFRTVQQAQQVIGSTESQKIYNAATPAIERAKAKLEYLFETDTRITVGVPSEGKLESMMRNVNDTTNSISALATDPYTLPGETRLNLDGNTSTVENAWYYTTDMDGDNIPEVIAYSIAMKTEADINSNGTIEASENIKNITNQSGQTADQIKANNFLTRSGPLTIQTGLASADCQLPELKLAKGWEAINSASVRKNFQIDAVVANASTTNRSVAALELQQDRQVDQGNKWAAWFRDDIDFGNPPPFNWNGAMHSEGSIYFGTKPSNGNVTFYLVSSPYSCLYNQDASEITINQIRDIDDADGDGNTQEITFQGQAIGGTNSGDTYSTSLVDIFPGSGKKPADVSGYNNVQLIQSSDSIKDVGNPSDYSLNPVAVFTEDKSESRYSADSTNVASRINTWNNSNLNKRIVNKSERKPYLDDTYRADNRWGPKPRYKPLDQDQTNQTKTTASNYGTAIDASITGFSLYNELTNDNPDPKFPEEVGLDGYWERRARFEGLRAIVGQRLELGNSFGWTQPKDNSSPANNNANDVGDVADPLYPPNDSTVENKDVQRRTLRDNLAAVQATAIYHAGYNQDFPIATLATTVHPGTTQTLASSTTFTDNNSDNLPEFDFFTGKSTNGWEFNAPGNVTTDSDFKALIDDTNDPLRIALSNLAHFAGDPDGAFPPKQNSSGTHPYPYLTMWGDFSNLRRVIKLLNNGTNYDNLSLADKTTLHTAAATLGMISYDFHIKEEAYKELFTDAPNMNSFAVHMWSLIDGDEDTKIGDINFCKLGNNQVEEIYCKSNYIVGASNILPTTWALAKYGRLYNRATDAAEFYSQFTTQDYINAITVDNSIAASKKAVYIKFLQSTSLTKSFLDLEADRTFGFNQNAYGTKVSGSTWNPATGLINPDGKGAIKTTCDPKRFEGLVSSGRVELTTGLAVAFCGESSTSKRKYPALYYLFPKFNHYQNGKDDSSTPGINVNHTQPPLEPYIADKYIFDPDLTVTTDVNDNFEYKVLKDFNNDKIENIDSSTNTATSNENGINAIKLEPRARTAWKLPDTTTDTGIGNKIVYNGGNVYVPFLDKGFYNGRELMGVRALDIDLNLLRNSTKSLVSSTTSDTWIPKSGIVYAFREDALREDGIARPKKSTKSWSDCDTESELTGQADCLMKTNPSSPQDPPVSSITGVSPKPVDFFADPYRRPFGFRLRNGSDLSRSDTNRGLSFISDNPIYIQGNFNLHQNNSGTLQEEFTTNLADDWNNFYGRQTLNTNFAKLNTDDRWRPTEVIGDAVTILSANFCDGTAASGFQGNTVSGCSTLTSSYLNSTTNIVNDQGWDRENSDNNMPIKVGRNGNVYRSGSKYTSYKDIQDSRTINSGVDGTRVNSIIVSGQVPKRNNQWNGGIINFPRFLESWAGQNLFIAGSYVQLNYSTYATGPWQHDDGTWEPSTSAATAGTWNYYIPPQRRWGYDVGLQYAPPGPVAQRFVSTGTPRSEVYQERSADDPYIKKLRCATITVSGSSQKVDKNATDCS